jgi:hypothetical protein
MFSMNDFLKSQDIKRQLQQLTNNAPHRASRFTPARILRTRVWVESILRDNHICRRQLQSLFFGEERESTGTVLRWLKGKQTVTESTVKNFNKTQSNNLNVFQFPIFQLLEPNLKKTELFALIKQYQKSTSLGYLWSFPHTEQFPLNEYANYIICSPEDSDALFQLGGVHGFLGVLMLVRLAEVTKDSTKHFLLMQDAYRAFPAFCRNKYFKKRWIEFFKLLQGIHYRVYTSALTIAPRIEIIQKQINAKHHPTIRNKWPRSSTNFRFIEPEKPFELASLPSRSCTSKTALFKYETQFF